MLGMRLHSILPELRADGRSFPGPLGHFVPAEVVRLCGGEKWNYSFLKVLNFQTAPLSTRYPAFSALYKCIITTKLLTCDNF